MEWQLLREFPDQKERLREKNDFSEGIRVREEIGFLGEVEPSVRI
jgi:hypothetical protein